MDKLDLELRVEEGNLILEALGQLPFVKGYALISKIQEQAQRQRNSEEERRAPADRSMKRSAAPASAE
jgi:hypothetical protein